MYYNSANNSMPFSKESSSGNGLTDTQKSAEA